jgi:hypothetical protein
VQVDDEGNVYVSERRPRSAARTAFCSSTASRFEFQPGETTAKVGLLADPRFRRRRSVQQSRRVAERSGPDHAAAQAGLPARRRLRGRSQSVRFRARWGILPAVPFRQRLSTPAGRTPAAVPAGDFTAYPDNASYYDAAGDTLFFADKNWARVMVSRNLLQNVPSPVAGRSASRS